MKDWLVWLLAGLGITFAPHEYFGGLFIAIGAGLLARYWVPIEKRRDLVLTVFTAAIAATVTAELLPHLAPDWPLQPAMIVAGFFSSFAIRFALGVATKVETKTGTVADRVIDRLLPDDKDQKP